LFLDIFPELCGIIRNTFISSSPHHFLPEMPALSGIVKLEIPYQVTISRKSTLK
jgi:hypothetical protein